MPGPIVDDTRAYCGEVKSARAANSLCCLPVGGGSKHARIWLRAPSPNLPPQAPASGEWNTLSAGAILRIRPNPADGFRCAEPDLHSQKYAVSITSRKAGRHIARPVTPARAPKRADSRIGSRARAGRTASRRETGAAAWSTTTTGARRPRRGATPCRNSNPNNACRRFCTPAPGRARGRKHPTRRG